MKKNVLIGNDGWLYLYEGSHNQFSYLLKEKRPSQESIDNFSENIKARAEYCKKKGIDYLHVVFPSKPVVCKKYLPNEYKNIESLFLANYSRGNVLYPEDALKEQDAFFKTDTHLNAKGSWLVLEKILCELGMEHENIKPNFVNFPKLGDLTLMLSDNQREDSWALAGTNEPTKVFKTNNCSALQSNTGRIYIYRNPQAQTRKRLLVFGDSFFTLMLDHLSVYFSDVIFVRTSSFNQNFVDLCCPDVVISGNAERYLAKVDKDKVGSPLFAKYLNPKFYDLTKQDKCFFPALNAQLLFSENRKNYDVWVNHLDSIILRDLALELESKNLALALKLMKKSLALNPDSNVARNMIESHCGIN